MNTRYMNLFTTIASSKSITEAANRLMISQPAVSMQLKRLEKEMGVTLISPHPKGILLTDAGQTFLEYSTRILAMEEQLLRAMEEYRGGQKGQILLGASPIVGTYVLPPYIASFMEEHSGIDLKMSVLSDEEIEKRVRDGQIDIGITILPPGDHLLKRVTKFKNDSWIVIEPISEVRWNRLIISSDIPIDMSTLPTDLPIVKVETTEILKQLVIAGHGIGITLQSTHRHELSNGLVRNSKLDGLPADVTFSIITRPAEKLAKSLWILLSHFYKST